MAALPEDVLRNIFSFLPQPTLLSCRLINRATGVLATALVFSHVRLEATRQSLSFLKISESVQLRGVVREITVDGSSDSQLGKHDKQKWLLYNLRYLLAMPRLRFFSGLQTLNIRFLYGIRGPLLVPPFVRRPNKVPGPHLQALKQDMLGGVLNFESMLLLAVMKCVAGEWTEDQQRGWQAYWLSLDCFAQLEELKIDRDGLIDFLLPTDYSQPPISLSTLTVSNLPDIVDERLYAVPAFQTLLSSRALKLLISPRNEPHAVGEQIVIPEQYDFFQKMPYTWLAPPIASNLRVLSLYCQDYFGWTPKFDFRMVNPSCMSSSGFPNLRVLALGSYVFSHQWQVDWVSSLGRENGRGGLEELYLDNCPIMWRALTSGPMDESLVDIGDGQVVDNHGYPLKEVMTRQPPYDTRWDPMTIHINLRWSSVLREWREKMQSLKTFKMGGDGSRGALACEMVAMARALDLPENIQQNSEAMECWRHQEQRRLTDTVHLNYDKPSVKECLEHRSPEMWLKHGVGPKQERECLLQYVHFNIGLGPSPWIERDFKGHMVGDLEDGLQRYEACRASDEQALSGLKDTIALRDPSLKRR